MINTQNFIKRLLCHLINNLSTQNMKEKKDDFSIRSTSARRNRSAQTSKRYSFLYIFFVLSNRINIFNRRNKSKCNARKYIPKKLKNIKSLALSPFLPVNKRLVNDENDHNIETTDTSQSEKYDMSHTS